jgi:ketosteroid isomerase-like protein
MLFASGFRVTDRRRIVRLDLDREQYFESMRWEATTYAVRGTREVLATRGDRVALVRGLSNRSNRDVGPSETESLVVVEVDEHGRRLAHVVFDPDDVEAAYAELDRRYVTGEGAVAKARPLIETAATRAGERFAAAWESRNWDHLTPLYAPSFRVIDRRPLIRLDLDRERYPAWMRSLFEMASSRMVPKSLATRGDRLSLARARFEGADGDVGQSESEWLALSEVDEHGKYLVLFRFAPDDLDGAYAELDERYYAGEAASRRPTAVTRAFRRAFAARDWDALAAVLAPDLVVHDHRILGWETLHGPARYIEALRSLVELAPDVRLRLDHIEMSDHRALYVLVWEGTHEGGAFETPSIFVVELDGRDRIRRFDQYDLDRLDQALARFVALRPDPLRIPPTTATRGSERLRVAFDAGDWDAFRALCAPGFVFEDRRRLMHLSGDVEMLLTGSRFLVESGVRSSSTVLATSGDRLALHHYRFVGDRDGSAWEAEVLNLSEVDAEGRTVAMIHFDPDDHRAASAEMLERYLRSDAGAWMAPSFVELRRGLLAHDLDGIRAVTPDDFVFHDHRRLGAGRLEGAGVFVAWLAALFEQSPDAMIETIYYVATDKHGFVAVGHTFGTNAEGGEFESVFVQLLRQQGGRAVSAELFELDDLDVARARFEQLRPDPLRIPPNAASRVRDRMRETAARRDWSAFRALARPDFTFDDRTRRSLVTGDLELFLENAVFVALQPGARVTSELIGTAGDRIALEHHVATGGGVGGGVRERVPQSGGGRRGRPARGHDLLGRRRSPRRVCRSERALPRRGGGRERRTG